MIARDIQSAKTPEELWRSHLPALQGNDWQARKQAIQKLGKYADPEQLLPLLLDAVETRSTVTLRNSALEILTTLGSKIVPALIELLATADPETQKFLIDVLGTIGSPLAAPRLATLLNHFDQNVRFASAEALGRIAAPLAAEALVNHLTETSEGTERFITLQALTNALRNGVPNDLTITALKSLRSDPLLTRALLDALRVIETPEADRFLWDWFSEFDEFRLQEAARLLGRLRTDRLVHAMQILGKPTIHAQPETLQSLMNANDPDVRSGSLWFALWTGQFQLLIRAFELQRADFEHLAATLSHVSDDHLKKLVAGIRTMDNDQQRVMMQLLAHSKDPGYCPLLFSLGRENPSLKYDAFCRLCELECLDALSWLPELLGDTENIDMIANGLKALMPAHTERILEILTPWSEQALATEQWHVLLALVERLNLVSLRNHVERAWKRAEPSIRASALAILAKFRLEFARHYLALALVDDNDSVRLAAAEIIADVAGPEQERELRMLQTDKNAWIRALGLRTLVRIQPERAEANLVQKLSDRGEIVRIEAIRSLRKLRLSGHVKLVRALLRHEQDPDVLSECMDYLRIAAAEPQTDDIAWMDHPNWRVRLAAMTWMAGYQNVITQVEQRMRQEEDIDVRALLGNPGL